VLCLRGVCGALWAVPLMAGTSDVWIYDHIDFRSFIESFRLDIFKWRQNADTVPLLTSNRSTEIWVQLPASAPWLLQRTLGRTGAGADCSSVAMLIMEVVQLGVGVAETETEQCRTDRLLLRS